MSKVKNVGSLDVRNIMEDLAKEITEIENVGVIIESDRSQVLLKDCKKTNIGATLKLPEGIKLITQNGKSKLDKDYLEGFLDPVAIVVNGILTVESDVDVELFNEKIYSLILNGILICNKKLAGVIQSKGSINGEVVKYNNGYKFFDGDMQLTNSFLKSLKDNSKLAFKKLIIIEDIDKKLLREKISNIQVLDKLIMVDKYEEDISEYIDEYYSVRKVIMPKGAKYIEDDIYIDNNSIEEYDHGILYVDGDVEIYLKSDVEFNKYIKDLICDTVICNKDTYDMIKDSLGKDVEIKIISGKLLENEGSMTLSGTLEEEITIMNMGKLIFDEKFDYEKFDENVAFIINYGVIEGPEDKLNIIKDKVKENYGKIKARKKDEKLDIESEDVLYSNIGELKL